MEPIYKVIVIISFVTAQNKMQNKKTLAYFQQWLQPQEDSIENSAHK